MKKRLICCALLLLITPLFAHEFWLQPDRYLYNAGQQCHIRFWVGENFEGENWGGNNTRVNFLTLNTSAGNNDLAAFLSGGKGDSLQFRLAQEGTAMVLFSSNNSYIALDAGKFNAYLEEDGLTEALAYRAAHNEAGTGGRENYQRSVKTLLQVNKKLTGNISQETALLLDIVPLSNPYDAVVKDSISFRACFRKKPVAHQYMRAWHRVNNGTTFTTGYTNNDGVIRFPLERTGKWMVSTVKMMRNEDGANAQWQSYWASCTWGYY